MPNVVLKVTWLPLYFVKTSAVWIDTDAPEVLSPQILVHLQSGSGTTHLGEWLLVRLCDLGS